MKYHLSSPLFPPRTTQCVRAFWLCAAAVALSLTVAANAANRCVRPTGDVSYNGDGSSWAAASSNGGPGAHRGLPASSSLVRGDTYYLADGSYSGATFSTAANGTTPVTIRKATRTDHGASSGWSDTLGDGQAAFTSQLQFTSRYWIVDGVSGGGPSGWKTGFGFKVTETRSTPVIWVNGGGNVDVSHVELVGAGNNGDAGDTGNDALQVYSGSGPTTISYAYLHDVGRCIFYHGGSSTSPVTASYILTGQYEHTGNEHSEWAVLRSPAVFTVRWSIITHEEGTGGIIAGDNGKTTAEIYGNVFYDSGTVRWGGSNNGLIAAFSSGSSAVNWKVYNNTFVNLPGDLPVFGIAGQSPSGNQARNNFYYLTTSHQPGSGWTQAYEHFQNSGSATGSNASTGTGDPFLDYKNLNFGLKAATPAGVALGAPYNVDMLGKTRTSWTRGALEFGSSAVTPPSEAKVQITTP